MSREEHPAKRRKASWKFKRKWSMKMEAWQVIGKQNGSEVGERIDFNTGRGYTAEGQQITAEVVAQKLCEDFGDMRLLVLMTDHSRGLEYLYDLAELTATAVLRHYDGTSGEVSYKRLAEYWGVGYRGDPIGTDYQDMRKKAVYQGS